MKTTTAIAIAAAALAMIPAAVNAATPKMAAAPKMASHKMGHKKMAMATKYECAKCHMQYSAKDAKAAKYKCEMDGGKLMPMKTASKMKPMHHM